MFAPVEGPQRSPSSAATRLAIAMASAVETGITSSKSSRVRSGGQKPTPPPSIRCVPGSPPEMTGDSAGSTITR